MSMWEFFSRKKEASPAPTEPANAVETKAPEGGPLFEQAPERAMEKVNEKYAAILSQSPPTQTAPVKSDVDLDADAVGRTTDAETRVNQLVELAQVKGVAHAVEVARKMNDLYVLDTMHDELADKLYDALKAKGLLLGE